MLTIAVEISHFSEDCRIYSFVYMYRCAMQMLVHVLRFLWRPFRCLWIFGVFFFCLFVCLLVHLSTECSMSYCDHSPFIGVRPSDVRPTSVHNFLVNTLASTNIIQSSPNLVKMYMTIRSQMSSNELCELSALELENLPYLTMFTL